MTATVREADVLVLGGGLAATWAAAAAAAAGADVVLADKGFCGTSGVTATAGPGHWWVPPEPALREAAVREREAIAEGLAERDWMARILDETWRTATTVPGLFAAGDVATRELVAGAVSGGGAQNSAWALSSGRWAGQAAVRRVRALGRRAERPADVIGGAGLRPAGAPGMGDHRPVVVAVQHEMLPTERNLFRTGAGLVGSRGRLDALWREVRRSGGGNGPAALRSREAAAMVAHARWCMAAALARTESRGMHRRLDAPTRDPRLDHRVAVGGLDQVWVRPAALPARAVA